MVPLLSRGSGGDRGGGGGGPAYVACQEAVRVCREVPPTVHLRICVCAINSTASTFASPPPPVAARDQHPGWHAQRESTHVATRALIRRRLPADHSAVLDPHSLHHVPAIPRQFPCAALLCFNPLSSFPNRQPWRPARNFFFLSPWSLRRPRALVPIRACAGGHAGDRDESALL